MPIKSQHTDRKSQASQTDWWHLTIAMFWFQDIHLLSMFVCSVNDFFCYFHHSDPLPLPSTLCCRWSFKIDKIIKPGCVPITSTLSKIIWASCQSNHLHHSSSNVTTILLVYFEMNLHFHFLIFHLFSWPLILFIIKCRRKWRKKHIFKH